MKYFITAIFVLQFGLTFTVYVEDVCKSQQKCSNCIAAHEQCAWCQAEGINDELPRCNMADNLIAQNCTGYDFVMPKHSSILVKDLPLSEPKAEIENIVQVQPQKIRIEIRPNSAYSFDIKFRQAEDYPVDLYYLMDLSKSMLDDKENLGKLGTKLAESMSKITRNFKLGFGSFVDKTLMPYVSTIPEKLLNPCWDTKCAPPYGFHHHMTLSSDARQFEAEVNRAPISGNLDAPEGGFDAIMQAVVCHNEIGWRNLSRKLVIFSTDQSSHYAGDGKLAGIVIPNDGKCHMSKGKYTKSLEQDYPSLSELRNKIRERKVNLIFAVTDEVYPLYQEFSKVIEGSSAGKLNDGSSNIVDLVRNEYSKITSSIEIKHNAPNNVHISFSSKCKGNQVIDTNKCSNLRVGDTVAFKTTLKAQACDKDQKNHVQNFQISFVGINDYVDVELVVKCECDCETDKNQKVNSPKCNRQGTYECGICNCNEDHYGKKCECNATSSNNPNDKACKSENSASVCSGRGTCSCGVCSCNPRLNAEEVITGRYCECDNFSCDRYSGKLCGGSDRGKCVCGKCQCETGWTGKVCECREGNKLCFGTNDKVPCSGNGECVCGQCVCTENYRGPLCDECPTCPGKCTQFTDCVLCIVTGDERLEQEGICLKCNLNITTVEVAEIKNQGKEKMCSIIDKDNCRIPFVYGYSESEDQEVYIFAQEKKVCPEPVNVLIIVLSVIGGILAIGIGLLILWKVLTTIHDRREFAKFQKDCLAAKWDTIDNPLFVKASTTFDNPNYNPN